MKTARDVLALCEANELDPIMGNATSKPNSFGEISVASDSVLQPFVGKIKALPRQTVSGRDGPLSNDAPDGVEQYYVVRVMDGSRFLGAFLADTQGFKYGRYWIRLGQKTAAMFK